MLQVVICASVCLSSSHGQLAGVCLEKKPWLLVCDYMQYKDLGVVLHQCRKLKIFLQHNETISFAVQVAEGLDYLNNVCTYQSKCCYSLYLPALLIEHVLMSCFSAVCCSGEPNLNCYFP